MEPISIHDNERAEDHSTGEGEGIQPAISCRDRKETLKRLRVFLKFLKAADGERERERRERGAFQNPGRLAGDIFSDV